MKGNRKMMTIILVIIVMIMGLFVLLDGSFMPKSYAKAWKDNEYKDIQYQFISSAIKASSSHNMQPWLIKIIDQNSIELYADMSKALKVIDEENTQLLISQGTFIKAYINAANANGYDVKIKYFTPDFNEEKTLIANLTVSKSKSKIQPDSISSSSFYDKGGETVDIIDTLDSFLLNDDLTYEWVDGEKADALKGLLLEGTIIESKDEEAMKELLSIFRFTEWDKNKYRYGLSLNTLPDYIKPFIQPIMKYSANWQSFGEQGIKSFKTRLSEEVGYILIKGEGISYKDYIEAGEAYTQLQSKLKGYSIRPAVQLLETFKEMKDLNNQFQGDYGNNGKVLLIIGVKNNSSKSGVTLRENVEDILLK